MDLIKLLKSINSLKKYMDATQVMITNSVTIPFNLTTVLALKNIRSYEVEVFNKYCESGAALKIFEFILQEAPSKTWDVVGEDLICLLQYWLEAVRNHLITHNVYWWNFLSILLDFIQTIYSKRLSVLINNVLVERTGDCLMDLATRSEPSIEQRYRILQIFNSYCAYTTQEFRLAMRYKFNKYFVSLSSIMANCGDVRVQYSMMETLIRWLLPRQNMKVREASAALWFPKELYTRRTVDVFLKQPGLNFFKETREFLNTHNETNDSVLSVICKKLTFGTVEIASGSHECWLDFNCDTKCLSIMLGPAHYKMLDISRRSLPLYDALVFREENTTTVQMKRENLQVLISLKVVDPLKVFPSKVLENNYDVNVIISSRSDFQKIDNVLGIIFDKKYKINSKSEDEADWDANQRYDNSQTLDFVSEEDTRFSNRLGVFCQTKTAQRTSSGRQSLSSVSTSSIRTLPEKLSDYSGNNFNKEVGRVSTRPQLRSIHEDTEIEERPSESNNTTDRISQSESYCTQKSKYNEKPDSNTSNNVLERLLSDNIGDDNIIDLLAQEALHTCLEESRKSQCQSSDAIHGISDVSKSARSIKCDKRENTHNRTFKHTTDESSNAFIENTPSENLKLKENTNISATIISKESIIFKNLNTKTDKSSSIIPKINNNKNKAKINDISKSVSSQSIFSCHLTNIENNFELNYIEVVQCLNAVVDKVCEDLENDLNQDKNKIIETVITKGDHKITYERVTDFTDKKNKRTYNKANRQAEVKKIKLKYPNSKKQMETRNSKRTKNNKISPIIESKSVEMESIIEGTSNLPQMISSGKLGNKNKKKRKLYSTKDSDILTPKTGGIHVSETEEDNTVLSKIRTINKTVRSAVTSFKKYKEMCNIRQSNNRNHYKNLFRSSKTEKNMSDIFDDIKRTVEGETNIKLVDTHRLGKDATVYNFTSGSEDDDFKPNVNTVPKSAVKKIGSRKTVRQENSKTVNLDSKYNKKKIKRKNSKCQKDKSQPSRGLSRELVDERMREATTDMVNTSLVIEPQIDELSNDPEPINKKPRMMSISDEKEYEIFQISDNQKNKRKKKNTNPLPKKKKKATINKLVTLDKTDDREVSPLPGLVVETVEAITTSKDSLPVNMIEKFKDIYKSNHLLEELEDPQTRFNSEINSCKIYGNDNDSNQQTSTKSGSNKSKYNQMVVVLEKLDLHATSMSTLGKSPITAHGISNEKPPDADELVRKISRRSLETQDLNEGVLNFFNLLTNEINRSFNNTSCENVAVSQYEVGKDENINNVPPISPDEQIKVNLSPSVSIVRLSPNEIKQYLTASSNASTNENTSNDYITRRQTRSKTRLDSRWDIVNLADNCRPSNRSIKNLKNKIYRSTISPINLELFETKEENNSNQSINVNSTTRKRHSLDVQSPKYNCKPSRSSFITKNSSTPVFTVSDTKGSNDKTMETVTEGTSRSHLKRRKNNINIRSENTNESRPSGSGVNGWFQENILREEANKDEILDVLVKEVLSTVTEKLDITLQEIHYNTSKANVQILVHYLAKLEQTQNENEDMLKQTTKNIITKLVNIIDEEFADMNRRSKEKYENITYQWMEKARAFLRNDVRQKKDMVELLKEDIQSAIMDWLARRNNSS